MAGLIGRFRKPKNKKERASLASRDYYRRQQERSRKESRLPLGDFTTEFTGEFR